jgi:protein-tyrosine-phosphatase
MPMAARKGLLFICLGNACRSIMAEALTRHYQGKAFSAKSAGIFPLGHIPEPTKEVLEEIGVSTAELYSKAVKEIDLNQVSLVVNLTEYALDKVIPLSFKGRIVNRYVRDPYGESLEAYRRTREVIRELVTDKIGELFDTESDINQY